MVKGKAETTPLTPGGKANSWMQQPLDAVGKVNTKKALVEYLASKRKDPREVSLDKATMHEILPFM